MDIFLPAFLSSRLRHRRPGMLEIQFSSEPKEGGALFLPL